MKKTLDILKELKTYFDNAFNIEVENYNNKYNIQLQKLQNISYTNTTMQLPELYFNIERTNFEYDNITNLEHYTLINEIIFSLAYRTNTKDFQHDMEYYIDILVKMLLNYYSENVTNIIIENVERGEMQDKNIQTIKLFVLKAKIITII